MEMLPLCFLSTECIILEKTFSLTFTLVEKDVSNSVLIQKTKCSLPKSFSIILCFLPTEFGRITRYAWLLTKNTKIYVILLTLLKNI